MSRSFQLLLYVLLTAASVAAYFGMPLTDLYALGVVGAYVACAFLVPLGIASLDKVIRH